MVSDTLLNWAVVIASFLAIAFIGWFGYRDLHSLGPSKPRRADSGAWSLPDEIEEDAPEETAPERGEGDRLRVEYRKDGRTERVQTVSEDRVAYIGTEHVPRMGVGVLLRHVRLFHEGRGFMLENRHPADPIAWRGEGGREGALPPGESIPVQGRVELSLGDYQVVCRENRASGASERE